VYATLDDELSGRRRLFLRKRLASPDERCPRCAMSSDEIRVETDPDQATIDTLRERLWQYNVASTGNPDGEELTISLRGPDGELRGGLFAHTWGGWLEIRMLWIHEDERGRGYGTRMLAAIEEATRDRGCHTSILDTHSFQAPELYKKLGYQVYAELEGYPPGHSKLFLRKSLRER
jgi:GNAT superfamily N-acetyltransferase